MVWKSLSSILLVACFSITVPVDAQAGKKAAYSHLNMVMDRFHGAFNVSTDLGAAGNHFAARCAIARNNSVAGIAFDESWTQNCRSGSTCIKTPFLRSIQPIGEDGTSRMAFSLLVIPNPVVIGVIIKKLALTSQEPRRSPFGCVGKRGAKR
jgi:hypothetical protein